MEYDFVGRIIDRLVADARVIRGAPEAIVLVGILGGPDRETAGAGC